MSNNIKQRILLIGAGNMAIQYARVLKAINADFMVLGRSKHSAELFQNETKIPVHLSSINEFVKEWKPSHAIVAVSLDQLTSVTASLVDLNVESILVEKPAGLNFEDTLSLYIYCKNKNSKIFVAYNRRFYSSVREVSRIIEQDGGATSLTFDFTEWGHVIKNYNFPASFLENWFFANSTHVIDLAFYLCGYPAKITSFAGGHSDWHPKGSLFTGSGITNKGVYFSYHANWSAPGRWGIEVMTSLRKVILRPIEGIKIQNIGSIEVHDLQFDNKLDIEFKPGIYNQVTAFVHNNEAELLNIRSHIFNIDFYQQILNGNTTP